MEQVKFAYADYQETIERYPLDQLKEGWNTIARRRGDFLYQYAVGRALVDEATAGARDFRLKTMSNLFDFVVGSCRGHRGRRACLVAPWPKVLAGGRVAKVAILGRNAERGAAAGRGYPEGGRTGGPFLSAMRSIAKVWLARIKQLRRLSARRRFS